MNNISSQTHDPDTILSTLGESYEYIRTIISNNIEIKKLELLNLVRLSASKVILGIVLGFVAFFLSCILMVLSVYGLYLYFDSFLYALLTMGGLLLFICIVLFLLRDILIYRKIDKAMNQIID